ncbi:Plasmodium exported protein (PHIST), unknown function [Plasmodium gallinaceum]|uniref:Plasmodium RESA N-terminal domain-containing protein n=1 Tax=Plasmodium gallinaceum TaxID=5849 RepID=A0A1J1GPN1_PLAGA|nr:Plasmodium exported protein (PHIST), unknown function [Plasmodium gallinaceum]CRG94466.1 Plasmodium exported protein (PHIST), unknown function [Plasmodium gallinaceum]
MINVILPKQSAIDPTIMKCFSVSSLEGENYVFKNKSNRNFMFCKIYVLSFLCLFFFTHHDKCNSQGNVSSEFNFKYSISRKLAASNDGRNANEESFDEFIGRFLDDNEDNENMDENISSEKALSILNDIQSQEEKKLHDNLKTLLDKLNKEAQSYGVPGAAADKMWSTITKETTDAMNKLIQKLHQELSSLVSGGSCTRREFKGFTDNAFFLWGKLRHELESIFWRRFYSLRR